MTPPATREPSNAAFSDDARREPTLFVGLGASAGGLDAIQRFLSAMPDSTGIAFLVLQHFPPDVPSALVDLLARHTSMPVVEASDALRTRPNHVYVTMPGTMLRLSGGVLRVAPLDRASGQGVIDVLFRSLGEDAGQRSVGITLSGAGQDGTVGLRVIKERGGLVLVQAPETAKHDSMPQSAIAAGVADHVLGPEELADKVFEHARLAAPALGGALEWQIEEGLETISSLVRRKTGHDFSGYKQGTLVRRIRRRLSILHVAALDEYISLLEKDASEAEGLVRDLLIGVTQFFRDRDVFQSVARHVVPHIVRSKGHDPSIRIWVPGCASGEEAYSIAMLVEECAEGIGERRPVQVFATDIDPEVLAEARLGRYPLGIAEQVGSERLAKFFVREATSYRVVGELRDMCVFSQHSLIRDPPFSQLDLLSCRNVLIYFGTNLQKKLVPLFHYALRPGGYLLVGSSENLTGSPDLFETVDKKNRVFRRKETGVRPIVDFPLSPGETVRSSHALSSGATREHGNSTAGPNGQAAFERMLISEYAVPSALVNARGEITALAGKIGRYFEPAAGAAPTNLLDLVVSDLRIELRLALQLAASKQRKVVRDNLPVELHDGVHRVRLTVRPVPGLEPEADQFALVVQERGPLATQEKEKEKEEEKEEKEDEETLAPSDRPVVDRLETELRVTRAELKAAVEELEAANEELKSSNEELISTNEELQSANEEMQSSKEELQSLNEELETVNTELRQKVEELGNANSDLSNLFASTEVATIFLSRDLRITKYTPAATALFRLLETDIGRSIGDFAPRFCSEDLVVDAREVLRTLDRVEKQLRTDEGRWFMLRVLPYRTIENVVAGVVATFVDITELKRAEQTMRESEERFRLMVESVRDYAIFMLHPDGTVATWNSGAERVEGYRAEEILGQPFSRFYSPEDGAAARAARNLEAAARLGKAEDDGWRVRKDGARFWADGILSAIRDETGTLRGFVKVVRDVTERKRMEEDLRRAEARQRRMFDSNLFGVIFWTIEGAITDCNDHFFEMTGYTREDLQAGRINWAEMTPRELGPRDQQALAEIRTTGIHATYEKVWLRKDGTPLPILIGGAAFDDGGRHEGVSYALDISERKRAEEALSRSEERLRLAQQAARIGSFEWDLRQNRTIWSPELEALHGLPPGGHTGAYEQWRALVHPDDLPEVEQRLRAAIDSGMLEAEWRVVWPDGTVRWHSARGQVYRDDEGKPLRMLGVNVDITDRKTAEQALHLTQRSIDVAAEMVAWLTPDGRIRYANDATCRALGYSKEDLSSLTVQDFTPGLTREEYQKHWQAVREKKSLTLEITHRRRDGSEYPAEVTVNHVVYAGEEYLFVYGQEISERKRAQEALRESEQKYAAIFDHAPIAIALMEEESGALIAVNGAHGRIFGYGQSEVLGKTPIELGLASDPAAVATMYDEIRRRGAVHDFEIEFSTSSGAQRVGSFSLERVDLGGRNYLLGTAVDITERRRAEEALRQSRLGLGRLATASTRIMAQTEILDMVQAISEAALELTCARIATCGHGVVVGRTVVGGARRVPGAPAWLPEEMLALDKGGGVHTALVDGADSIRLSEQTLRADPRRWGLPEGRVPMRGLLGVPIRARNGKPNGMILVTDREEGDFSEQDESLLRQLGTIASLALQHVEARLSLEEADRRKNEFLAMLSHELRNPLAPIRNSTYILERAAPGSDQARRAQAVISRQTTHMAHLVDDLLDVTRITRGKIQLQREIMDLAEVTRRVLEDHRSSFSCNNIELETLVPSREIWLDADRTRVAQVIGNLLQNAAKFTPAGGRVTVEVSVPPRLREATLQVRDTGTGIAADMLARIFEPFTQADRTLDRSKGGLGLGLALVKGIVEMHGGTVTVESQGLGRGAAFTVRFPLSAERATSLSEPHENGSSRSRVLIIEDNVDAAESLREVLELTSHVVEVALSGPEGIAKAKVFEPDVVLCDIGLPGMSGYEVARAMRADPALGAASLVALTGYAGPEDVARSREAGFDAHLAKPPNLDQIQKLLSRREPGSEGEAAGSAGTRTPS